MDAHNTSENLSRAMESMENAVGLRTILGGGGMGRNVPQCIGRCSHSVSRSICSFVY